MYGDDDYSDDDESLGEVFADLGPDWFDRNAVDILTQPERQRIGKEDNLLSFNDKDLDKTYTVDYADILLCLGLNDKSPSADELDIEKIFQDFQSNDLETLSELEISDKDFM